MGASEGTTGSPDAGGGCLAAPAIHCGGRSNHTNKMASNTDGTTHAGQVIVVVEDQTDTRDSLRKLLEIHGYHVETAADGPRGLDLLLGLHPDLGIVDIGLPRLDGYQVAQRARRAGLTIPLVAVSGYGMPADKQQALQAGFDAHLTKPAEPRELLALITHLLQRVR